MKPKASDNGGVIELRNICKPGEEVSLINVYLEPC